MRSFTKWAVVLVVPAVVVATAWAAEQAVPEGTTVKLLLLRQKSVQKELKLTAEQKKKVVDFTNKQHEKFLKTLKLVEVERKQKHKEMAKENEKFLKDTLMQKQHKRLDQITMQFAALHYLLKPETAKSLNLTDKQIQKFKDLQQEARKALVDVIQADKREGRNKKLAKLREDTRTKILAVLTDEQKAKVREMAGPRFMGEIVFEEPD
jgi:Spy/CpxP family protein refolding chaperone